MIDRIQVRRDTAANWTVANSTLTAGEFGFETDTGFIKIGNGTTVWNSLLYVGGASVVSVNGDTGVVVLTTSDISEGSNKYYTNTRVASYLTAPGPIGATTPNAGTFTTMDLSGNLGHIRGIPYTWPVAGGAAGTYLGDDGAGNLLWSTPPVTPPPTGTAHTSAIFDGAGALAASSVLYDTTGTSSLDTNSRLLNDNVNVLAQNWGIRQSYRNDGTTVAYDWNAGVMNDPSGNASIYIDARSLRDSTAHRSVEWGSRDLIISIAHQSSLNWDLGQLFDIGGGALALQWDSRLLIANDGSTAIQNWTDPAQIAFGTGTPKTYIKSTGVVRHANMTTTQRDALTPEAGDTIFNTTAVALETYDGTLWV